MIQDTIKYFQHVKNDLDHNRNLIEIYEGQLLKFVEQDLKDQLSLQSYSYAKKRVSPINILTKIVNKLSSIYATPPKREVVMIDGSEPDEASKELLAWYEKTLDVNNVMSTSCKLFNMCKSTAIYPFLHGTTPKLRVFQNNAYFVYSTDTVDPMNMTNFVTVDWDGSKYILEDYTALSKKTYSETGEILAVDENIFGQIPVIYKSSSALTLFPCADTDIMKMVKLIPVLISDLNFAVMFQTFSIMYGINLEDENLVMSPNAFWRLKSDPTSDAKPEIGMIKPQVEIEGVLSFIQSQLSLWLNTKGIRPGSIGDLNKDSFASGISKIVDEMDTYEMRIELANAYSKIESSMWDMVLKTMHPIWVGSGLENKTLFNPNAKVEVKFNIPKSSASRSDMIQEVESEFRAGFTSRRRAIKHLNPMMSEQEIDALLLEIDQERVVVNDSPSNNDSSNDEDLEDDQAAKS